MPLFFVTGNVNKFKDAQTVFPEIEQLNIDLPEIQDLDPHKIIQTKIQSAFEHHSGPFIVDDVSMRLECIGGLPGPLIKWFIKSIGIEGIAAMAEKLGNTKAEVSSIIGYAKSPEDIHYFTATATGDIVSPRGSNGFGWDPIFLQEGSPLTFAEIKDQEAGPNAMRKEVLHKLKDYLENTQD